MKTLPLTTVLLILIALLAGCENSPIREKGGSANIIRNTDPAVPNLMFAADEKRGVTCYRFEGHEGIFCFKGGAQ